MSLDITRETDDTHKIIKWLTTDYSPRTLSVSKDGELLIINQSSHSLMIYGSDAELIRSIPITRDIKNPQHAVETSRGNFIISERHIVWREEEQEEDGTKDEDKDEDGSEDEVVLEERKTTKWLECRLGKGGSNRRMREMPPVVSEVTKDGHMVIRRFIPSDETQQLIDCRPTCTYLLIDSDDRVFVPDCKNDKVILLDTDLNCNRILCPTTKEKEEQIISYCRPCSLFYDDEMRQLIVGGYSGGYAVNVYTLSLN